VIDQFIDGLSHAPKLFGKGCVAHVSMADPVCGRMVLVATGPAPV
jgi:hypothetical protein